MKKTLNTIIILVNLLLLFLYLLNSEFIIKSFLDYTNIFITKLAPFTFLNILLISILIDYNLLDMLPIKNSNLYVFFLSLLSGFPSGAIFTKEIFDNNLIDYNTGNSILTYSHFPNLLFMFGTVNLIINNSIICIKIFISIVLSNFILYLFSKKNIYKNNNFNYNSFSNILTKNIIKCFRNIILIYGISIFFYLISCIIFKYISFNTYSYVFISGIFDLLKGVFTISLINNDIKYFFILFFISFGGISIHMQVKSIISNKLSYKYFFVGRIISTVLAIIIFCILKEF